MRLRTASSRQTSKPVTKHTVVENFVIKISILVSITTSTSTHHQLTMIDRNNSIKFESAPFSPPPEGRQQSRKPTMASHVVVIASNARRATVKVTPSTHLSDVLQEACQKLGFNASQYGLK